MALKFCMLKALDFIHRNNFFSKMAHKRDDVSNHFI